ncbi:MAG: hypothetical protein FIA94_10855 [Nitrospirae bacterium]|nr:hypothetical protein [Nitrospirota bacterium]
MRIGDGWKQVPLPVLAGGTLAAAAFCIHALTDTDGFLLLDHVNLPFHEFGHLFFSMFGETIGVWGGTLMQLCIPLGIFVYFFTKRETAGVFFCLFWSGENLLNIAAYVNDARALALPLVGGGEHDWNIILGRLGLLRHDHVIAGALRALGWSVMTASIVWFLFRGIKGRNATDGPGGRSAERSAGIPRT